VTVRNSAGATVFESAAGIMWVQGATWHPGQPLSWSFTWDQHAAPGLYVASGSWDSYRPGYTYFVLGA
jgi:hypothetical protein